MCREACLKRILGGVSVAAIAAGLAVTITAQTPSNNTIYACVNPAGLVRIIPPRAACLGSEQPIQWNIAGPAGPQGPPGPSGVPMGFVVDCGAGQTVGDALARGTDQSGRLFITIRGVCQESVYIARDDVILSGESEGDGLAVSDPGRNVLTVAGGQRVHLQNLTLQGGGYGFLVHYGSSVTGEGVRITGAREGLAIWDGTVRLSKSTIEESQTNFSVGAGGRLLMSGCTIRNATGIGGHVWGGAIEMNDTTVSGNKEWGIGVMQAHVRIVNSTITNNGRLGVWLHGGGVSIGNSQIAGHTGHGLEVSAGTVDVGDTTIENNGWNGISAGIGSRISLSGQIIIRDNAEHGILLGDTSVAGGNPDATTQITSNGRHGVLCEPAPAVAQLQSHYSGVGYMLNATQVFGNTQGQISCPGIVVK